MLPSFMVAFTGSSIGSAFLQQLPCSLLQLLLVITFFMTAFHEKQALLLWSCCKGCLVKECVFCRKVVLANAFALDLDLGLSPLHRIWVSAFYKVAVLGFFLTAWKN